MSLSTDLRFALRRLRAAPGFALISVVMLTLGIALSVAMFSVVRGVLLGALPYPDGDRIVVVRADNPRDRVDDGALTAAEATRLAADDGPFAQFGYYTWGGLTVHDARHPREFSIVIVSQGFFPALDQPPLLGRWFDADDFASGSDAVVLAHAEWQRLLGGDPDAIGRVIDTSDGRMRVIGVMPAGFETPIGDIGAFRPWPTARLVADAPWFWNARFVNALARLPADRDGAGLQARLDGALADVRRRYDLADDGWQLRATPLLESIVGRFQPVLWGAFGLALLVFLIGCANLAILLDARQLADRHQHAIVQALGASRVRLYRVLMLEIGLLGIVAVALGSGLAVLGIELLRELARGSLPRVDAIALDPGVLALAAALGLSLPFVTAAAGALRLRAQPADAIRAGGRGVLDGGERHRRLLPMLGIALSTVSLVAASGLLLSLWKLQQVQPGFRSHDVHALLVYRQGELAQWPPFADAVLQRLQALPGVDAVALTTDAPLGPHGRFLTDLQRSDRDRPEPLQAILRRVDAGYLPLLQAPLLAGRGIEASDRDGSEPVVVINQTLAERVFGDAAPLGQRIGLPLGNGERIQHRVVGVMADQRNAGLRAPVQPELLVPYAQRPFRGITFLVRGGDRERIDAQIGAALWEVDPREAASEQFTLQQMIDEELRPTRFFVRTVGLFAAAALLLAMFGVYAVASLQQRRRTGEFGLRLAIGARPARLARAMLGEVMKTAALGVGLGLVGGWAVLAMLRSQLFGIDGAAPLVVAGGVTAMLLAALLAGWLPARQVLAIQPMQALRND